MLWFVLICAFTLKKGPFAMSRFVRTACTCALAAVVLAGTPARADSRRFAWTYDSGTMPRGVAEYEQWFTWRTARDSDAKYDRLELRQEVEYGLTDRLQVALYLADWRYTRTSGGSDTELRGTAAEVTWNLSDPVRTPLGVALYGEVQFDSRRFAAEGKLLLEKQAGAWVFAYNAVVESEWEGQDWGENNGELQQLLAASRAASPRLSLGAEFLHEVGVANWERTGDSVFCGGPCANLLVGRGWWLTAAPLWQLSDLADEPNLRLRLLAGVTF